MNKRSWACIALVCVLALSCSSLKTAFAEPAATPTPRPITSGNYQYVVDDTGNATITDWSGSETELFIPDSLDGHTVTSIGNAAFSWCESLTSITLPDTVTSIGNTAFSLCESLTSITLPDTVTSIGTNPFRGCYGLTTIRVSPDHPIYAVINGVLFDKAARKLICYPCAFTASSYVVPDGITSIGDDAFDWCNSLTSITLPDTVTSIGTNPFQYCHALTTIRVSPDHPIYAVFNGVLFDKAAKKLVCYPYAFTASSYAVPDGITSIGDSAFVSCGSLTSITLPDTVTSIGDSAFEYCDSLTSITLSNTVTSIGDYAFDWCCSLTGITLPDTVTSIGTNPFRGCYGLMTIRVSPDHPIYAVINGVLFDKTARKLVCYPYAFTASSYVVPDGITSIGDSAFDWCNSLTSITLPDSVTSIGDDAFAWCSSLTSITLPDTVTSIGDAAFSSCSSLTSITLPDTVTSIGANPFYGCYALTTIWVSPDHPIYAVLNGVLFEKAAKKLVCYPYAFTASSYAVPDGITSIGDWAFSSCKSLANIALPDTVTSIGDYAFSWCESLTGITLQDSVTSIGNKAFDGCSASLVLTVPRGSYAAAYAEENNIDYIYPD